MSTPQSTSEPAAATAPYRAISTLAVIALVLGLASLVSLPMWLAFEVPLLAATPVAGLIVGVLAARRIRRFQHELTGLRLVTIGRVLCVFSLLVGGVVYTTVFVMEVPEGCRRVSFYQLGPDPDHPERPFSQEVLELDGQRVFLKGYLFQVRQSLNIKQFVLTPMHVTSSLERQPTMNERVHVKLGDGLRIKNEPRKFAVAGTLHVSPYPQRAPGVDGVYFRLEADYVK